MDVDDYLRRIGHDPAVVVNEECLASLHGAQLHTIPFENLDIHLGRPIDLAPENLANKLIYSARGGYCFELNGLFLAALQGIGFDARPLLGRVHITGEATGRGHQITLVNLQGKDWIVDVGFGVDTPRGPVPFELDSPTQLGSQIVRIVKDKNFGFMLQTLKDSSWKSLYSFDLEQVCQGDIDYGNYYTSNSPGSIFTVARIVVLPRPDGVISLFDTTLKEESLSRTTVTEIEERKYAEVLEYKFGIRLPE